MDGGRGFGCWAEAQIKVTGVRVPVRIKAPSVKVSTRASAVHSQRVTVHTILLGRAKTDVCPIQLLGLHLIALHKYYSHTSNTILCSKRKVSTCWKVQLHDARRSLLQSAAVKCRAGALGGQKGDWLLVIAGTVNTAIHCALHTALLVTRRTSADQCSDGRPLY